MKSTPQELGMLKREQSERFYFLVYTEEMKSLSKDKEVHKSSRILKLDPFYDSIVCVIRVGGRLQHSDLQKR